MHVSGVITTLSVNNLKVIVKYFVDGNKKVGAPGGEIFLI